MQLRKISSKILITVITTLAIASPINAYGSSFFNNSISKSPEYSRELSVYLVDLSGSVDHEIVMQGFKNVRTNVANVFIAAEANQKIPTSSYYQWIPIRGSEANSASLPLFTEEDDAALWSSVRTIKGKSNQLLVLKKLRERNGLWSQLMNAPVIDSNACMSTAYQTLRNPGVSGASFKRLNANICTTALRVRERFVALEKNILAFTGENRTRKTTGSDVLGTIKKLENVARNSNSLQRYEKIRLIFVSDMIHQTGLIDLKKKLLENPSESACLLGKKYSSASSGFKNSQFFVTIYGLGEQRYTSKTAIVANEKIYEPLRQFWDCYWTHKGLKLPDSEFKSLNSFSENI